MAEYSDDHYGSLLQDSDTDEMTLISSPGTFKASIWLLLVEHATFWFITLPPCCSQKLDLHR